MRKFLLLIIIMIAAAGCGSDEPCSVQSEDFLFEIARIENQSPGITSSGTVDKFEFVDQMEELIKEAKDLNSPRCAREYQDSLVTWYESLVILAKASITNGDVSVEFFTAEREGIEAMNAYFAAKGRFERELDE